MSGNVPEGLSVEFGTVTHAVGHSLPFERTLATIKRIGFDSILLLTSRDADPVAPDGTCKDPFPDILRSDPEHVRKAVRSAGLDIGALHFSGKIDLDTDAGIDPTTEALSEYARFAVALGCRTLSHPVPSCGRTGLPAEQKREQIQRLARCMNTVAQRFEGDGLHVVVDIHYGSWVESLDDCRLLLNEMDCPASGILLNIGHQTTAQSYGWLLVDEYPDRIHAVGWKDHSLAPGRPRPMWSIELGTGHSPFPLYVGALKRHVADRVHFINCEHLPDDERVAALVRSHQYMVALWEQVK